MNQRNVCIVGLAAVAAVLAGCAAQYRNPSSCVAEMHSRLDETQHGELTVTDRAVSYRGQRVVIEGRLEQAGAPTAASAPASAHAQTPATALAGSGTETAPAASASTTTVATAATSASTSPSGAAHAAAASTPAQAKPHPTTPVGALVAHFAHPHKTTPVAAECTFGESGLTSFRWLAPPALAKTTPAPAHSN